MMLVNGTIDGDDDVTLAHLLNQLHQRGGYQMCCSSRHYLTDIAKIDHILCGSVLYSC